MCASPSRAGEQHHLNYAPDAVPTPNDLKFVRCVRRTLDRRRTPRRSFAEETVTLASLERQGEAASAEADDRAAINGNDLSARAPPAMAVASRGMLKL